MSGEGMKTFYDRILKQFTEKYIKKWGSKVGVVELPEVEEAGREMWGFDVTPAMKAAVMGRGQPLFQSASTKKPGGAFSRILEIAKSLKGTNVRPAVRQVLDTNINQLDEKVKDEFAEIISNILNEVVPNGLTEPITSWNLPFSLRNYGFESGSGSVYRTINGNTVRVSRHSMKVDNFGANGETGNLVSIKIEQPGDFSVVKSNPNVDAVEYVFRAEDLTKEKLAVLISDILGFFDNGYYEDHVRAVSKRYSGSKTFENTDRLRDASVKADVDAAKDAAFAEAEANGDTATAQRLVDEAAGYDASKPHGPGGVIKVYHYGTLGNDVFVANQPIHFGTEEAAKQRIPGRQVQDMIEGADVFQDEYGRWAWEYDGIESPDTYNTEAEARNELAAAANQMTDSDNWDEGELDSIHAYFINTDNFMATPDMVDQKGWDKVIAEAKAKGYRGIRYRNQYEDKGSWSYIVFNPGDMKLADPFTYDDDGNRIPLSERFNDLNPDVRYQSNKGEPHRGALTSLNDDWEATMALFDSADGSTVVHETAHFIFDMMEKFVENGLADERMESDYRKLVAWMTLTSEQAAKGYEAYLKTVPEGTDAMTLEQWKYIEEQERLARGFEAYCMEGRAPSVELQGAFATLRRILLHIYKTVRALGVQLTDDVRQVFDGMLATETTLLRDSILLEAAEQIDRELALMEKRDACSKHAYRGLRKQAPRTRMRPDLI